MSANRWAKDEFRQFESAHEFSIEPKGLPKEMLIPGDLLDYDGFTVQLYRQGVAFEYLTLRACLPAGWMVPTTSSEHWMPKERMSAEQVARNARVMKITTDEVVEIKRLAERGASMKTLAEMFGLSISYCRYLVDRYRFLHE